MGHEHSYLTLLGHMWAHWLHNHCHLGGSSAQHGDNIESGYFTPAVSGAHMWVKWLHSPYCLRVPSAQHGDKIISGYLTHDVSGAHMWAKWRHNPCRVGGSQRLACG